MKKKATAFFATLLLATSVYAQNIMSEAISHEELSVNKGFRIGIVQPSLILESKTQYMGESYSSEMIVPNTIGLSFGYEYLPIQALGWTTNLTFLSLGMPDFQVVHITKIDGNLAFAFTDNISLKGGLNLASVKSDDEYKKFSADFGIQAALEINLTRNLSLDVGYSEMRQVSYDSEEKVEVKESGYEIGLYLNF